MQLSEMYEAGRVHDTGKDKKLITDFKISQTF